MTLELNDLLSVGDRVKIVKPKKLKNDYWFRWIPEMDKYDGINARIIKVLDLPEDEDMPAYDLDIDGGELGWLHIYLQPIKHDI